MWCNRECSEYCIRGASAPLFSFSTLSFADEIRYYQVMVRKAVILILVLIGLLLAGCTAGAQATGTLEGNVTIGPLQPVQRQGENPPVPPEVYAARKVMVYDKSGKNLIKQVDIDNKGHYQVELKPATYTIDINRIGIDHSGQVPRQIVITANQTVTLNIDIDTGIR